MADAPFTDDVVVQPTTTGDDPTQAKPWLKFRQNQPAPILPDLSSNPQAVARLPFGTNYMVNGGTFRADHPTPPNAMVPPAPQQKPWEMFAKTKTETAPITPTTPDLSKVKPTAYEAAQLATGGRDPSQMPFEAYQTLNPLTPQQIAVAQHGGLAPETGWNKLKFQAENILNTVFPGYAEKATGNPFEVTAQSAMLLPVGMPERLAKPLMALFTAQAASQQPAIVRQIHDELKSGDYSAAQKTAIQDALQLGIVAANLKGMKAEQPEVEPWQGPPVSGRQMQTPPGAVPPPEPNLGPMPGVPSRGIPAPTMPHPAFEKNRPVVPGTPAEPYETSIQTVKNAGAKTIADVQKLFPKAGLSREQARVLRDTAWGKPTPKESYAQTIRGYTGQLRTPGQVPEGGQEISRHDVEQPTPEQSQPVDQGKQESEKGKVLLSPHDLQPALEINGQLVVGDSAHTDHSQLMKKLTDEQFMAYSEMPEKDKAHVFVQTDAAGNVVGKPLSREEAAQAIGHHKPILHSEDLNVKKEANLKPGQDPAQVLQSLKKIPALKLTPGQRTLLHKLQTEAEPIVPPLETPEKPIAAPTDVDTMAANKVFTKKYDPEQTLKGVQSGNIKTTEGAMGALVNQLRRAKNKVGIIKQWADYQKTLDDKTKELTAATENHPARRAEFLQHATKSQLPREALDNIAKFGEREFPPEVVQAAREALGYTPEPAAPELAKAQTEVTRVATTEGQRPAKEVKEELVAELEQAVRKAPMAAVAAESKTAKTVTIEIPGDGKFTMPNVYEAVSRALEKAKKIKTDTGKPPGVPRAAIKTSSAAIRATAGENARIAAANRLAEKKTPSSANVPGKVLGFGGTGTRPPSATPVANTPSQLATLIQAKTPGLNVVGHAKQGLQSLLLPTSKSPEHLHAAELLGAKLGAMNRRAESAAVALRSASKYFDRLGVHNENLAPGQNPGVKFMSDMSQGRPLTGKNQLAAYQIKKLFAERLTKLEDAGAPLDAVRKNYFPGMWTRESREAFNAAMEEAQKQGIIKPDDDVNNATQAQKDWVKNRTDQLLDEGHGSEADMMAYFTRRPLKGQESFRKQKVFDDIMTGAEFGLRPISNNPIDLVKGKLAEMDKSIMANEFFRSLKEEGNLKIINPYEQTPEGWVRLNDKYGTIYGPPTVKVPEYIDKNVYEGLLNFAKSLGITHERSVKFPRGPGQSALGLSYQGKDFVRTKFATETSVLAHEIGHQLDYRYDFWKSFVTDAVGLGKKGAQTKGASQKARVTLKTELRNIADMTGGTRGGHERERAEQIAQMVEAYVHAPDKMKEVAPTVYKTFDDFIKSKPDLKGLADIKPNIELKQLVGEKYVGLPIKGYRIVPTATGDVVNNYLSSSLYNNKYFGGLYKAWMSLANALNQTQLGLGSAFHAGFTTADVQVSAGAEVLKDIYGVIKGNRSLSDLTKTSERWVTASVGTAATGDKVLNAWRNPDGVIDPRIAQVAKAVELGGGGFKMEHGLMTEQSTQLVRDWYSEHKVRAAARSPVAASELMMQPIMQYLVPRQKAGVFANMAWRIIEQHPDTPLEELTPQFRQAWNRDDARLGQVRYTRLFANNTAKNLVQAMVRAPGWSGGTIAELGGAFPDTAKFLKEWVTTGKMPENLPDRTAYTISLLATIGAINGALTYAFTGQMPTGMDYLAFRTGRKDKDGNNERFLLPSYVKDLLAYAKQPLTTIGHKTHPLVSVLTDLANNKDYYGYEIRDPNASIPAQAGEAGTYVLRSFEPFWIQGLTKNIQGGINPATMVAPYFGVMPAPAYVTRTAIQNQISQLYHLRTGERVKPYDSRTADAEKRSARDASKMDIYMFKRLPKSDQEALRKKMSPEETARYFGGVSGIGAGAPHVQSITPWANTRP